MKNKLYIYYIMAGGLFEQPFVLNIKCIIYYNVEKETETNFKKT